MLECVTIEGDSPVSAILFFTTSATSMSRVT